MSDIRSDSYSHVIIQFASQKLFQSATFAVPAIAGADFSIKGLKPPLKSTFRLDGSQFSIIVDTYSLLLPYISIGSAQAEPWLVGVRQDVDTSSSLESLKLYNSVL